MPKVRGKKRLIELLEEKCERLQTEVRQLTELLAVAAAEEAESQQEFEKLHDRVHDAEKRGEHRMLHNCIGQLKSFLPLVTPTE